MVSVNEIMCPSGVYLHGPKWKLGVGELIETYKWRYMIYNFIQ